MYLILCSYNTSHLTLTDLISADLISADLISAELNRVCIGCEFCDQSEPAYCLCHVTRVVAGFTLGFYMGGVTYCILCGHSHSLTTHDSCPTSVATEKQKTRTNILRYDSSAFDACVTTYINISLRYWTDHTYEHWFTSINRRNSRSGRSQAERMEVRSMNMLTL